MYQQAKELLGSGEVLVSVLAGTRKVLFPEQRKERDEKKRDGKRCANVRLLMTKKHLFDRDLGQAQREGLGPSDHGRMR
jgi:hypothetical protein